MLDKILGLKIDVDTYQGMRDGVPRLLKTLRDFNIKGSFYLSVGPDASGRALLQLFRNPRFLQKMLKSNAAGMYGIKTALYGTLLPSPNIALSFPHLVAEMLADGHDVQFHAWDHRRWQDDLSGKDEVWIEDWFAKGVAGFESLTGKKPVAFGAPGWVIDERVLKILPRFGFKYLSCTRASEPFIHKINGLVEVPSGLPCFEEVGIENGVKIILSHLAKDGTHILPVHSEVEGGIWQSQFVELLTQALGLGYRIKTVDEIFLMLRGAPLATRDFEMRLIAGRAFPCAL